MVGPGLDALGSAMAIKRGFVFDETMSGTWVRDGETAPRPLSFSVQAHAPSLLAHLRDGKARLQGTIEAPGLAAHTTCEGEITIRPIGQRIIRYELGFLGDDGVRYRLFGEKTVRLRSLRQSMTVLPAEIREADTGKRVGTADTRFDLDADLLHFVASWRPA
jgi:hypothetical protein